MKPWWGGDAAAASIVMTKVTCIRVSCPDVVTGATVEAWPSPYGGSLALGTLVTQDLSALLYEVLFGISGPAEAASRSDATSTQPI